MKIAIIGATGPQGSGLALRWAREGYEVIMGSRQKEKAEGIANRSVVVDDENRIVLTFDRDYGGLIYRHKFFIPAGVIYFRFNPSTPKEPAEILLNILEKGNVTIVNRFTVVERDRIRQRTFWGKR